MPDDVNKRLRYFNGQFLQAQDFQAEQAYHLDRQRRHNRLFHTPGVAQGLTVGSPDANREVEVSPGTAVDGQGRLIVLLGPDTVSLGGEDLRGQPVQVVICYAEEASDESTVGDAGQTRWNEGPALRAVPRDEVDDMEDCDPVPLAEFEISQAGVISRNPDTGVRQEIGVRAGALQVGGVSLQIEDTDQALWPTLAARVLVDSNDLPADRRQIRAGGDLDVSLGDEVSPEPLLIEVEPLTDGAEIRWHRVARRGTDGVIQQFVRIENQSTLGIEVRYRIYRLFTIGGAS